MKNNIKEIKEIKEIKNFCIEHNIDNIDIVCKNIKNKIKDFRIVNGVKEFRFILQENIDNVVKKELINDKYMLGCFDAIFLSDIIKIDANVIKMIQAKGAFEALGELVVRLGEIDNFVSEYIFIEGYGHHFAFYNGEQRELLDYYVFRIN